MIADSRGLRGPRKEAQDPGHPEAHALCLAGSSPSETLGEAVGGITTRGEPGKSKAECRCDLSQPDAHMAHRLGYFLFS